jgi:hypothetical protein
MHPVVRSRGDTIGRIVLAEMWPIPMTTPDSPEQDPPPAARPASLGQIASAVFWIFFGIRRGKDMERDTVTIKPLHIVIAGLVAGIIFVLALVALVTFLTRKL